MPTLPIKKVTNSFIGSDMGSLTIEREVASGAFGTLFKCFSSTGDIYAIKQIEKSAAGAVGELMCAAEKFQHPNVLTIQEIFASPRGLCLRMPFLPGCELFELCGHLTTTQAIRVSADLGCGLRHLHAHRLVHRDVKPENVIIWQCSAVLVDLGSVRTTSTMALVQGAAAYMAPEAKGKKRQVVEPSLDSWSLGITLCVAILGRMVKTKAQVMKLANANPDGNFPIINRAAIMMEEKVEDRPSVAQFVHDIDDFVV